MTLPILLLDLDGPFAGVTDQELASRIEIASQASEELGRLRLEAAIRRLARASWPGLK